MARVEDLQDLKSFAAVLAVETVGILRAAASALENAGEMDDAEAVNRIAADLTPLTAGKEGRPLCSNPIFRASGFSDRHSCPWRRCPKRSPISPSGPGTKPFCWRPNGFSASPSDMRFRSRNDHADNAIAISRPKTATRYP